MKIGFIGTGSMGSAMINGLSSKSDDINIYAYDINYSSLSKLDNNKVIVVNSNYEVIQKSKYVVLAIKPQFYKELFEEIKPYITNEHVVITIAPGFSIQVIKEHLGDNVKVVRAMPNTPALVNEGLTAYCYLQEDISDKNHEEIKYIFSAFGKSIKIKEDHMEAIIATTGSSPAYAFMFIEAMADAAVSLGISRDVAYELSAQSLKGAATMVLDSKEHPAVLKDAVCSPGGTTIEAVLKLEETQFRNSIIKAMRACYDKAMEMNN